MKKSSPRGSATSLAEVLNVSPKGMWLLVKEHEHFLPFDDYPWFEKATIAEICDVKLIRDTHLHWPQLDVDLDVDGLGAKERYPLVYR